MILLFIFILCFYFLLNIDLYLTFFYFHFRIFGFFLKFISEGEFKLLLILFLNLLSNKLL